MKNKEKIIIGVLAVIFLSVLLGMIWDLYGKNLLNKSTTTISIPTPTNKNNANKPTKSAGNKAPASQENIAYSTYSTCIENAKDLPSSKDCCDCLTGDASVHKACRDAAAEYDFTKNTVIKTFDIRSTLGKTGNYSMCTASGNQQQCKQCCESTSTKLACGDYQFCRTACNGLAQ